MPRYMYADSTDFPLQRDFIDLLERFSDAAIEAVPVQKRITDLAVQVSETESEMKNRLSEIDRFVIVLESSIDAAASEFEEESFAPLRDRIKETSLERVKEFRESQRRDFDERVRTLKEELERRKASLLQILGEYLFHDPLEAIGMKAVADLQGDRYDSWFTILCSNGISYTFATDFSKGRMKVEDLLGEAVRIPVSLKKTLFGDERKPHFVSVGDWILSRAEYVSKEETSLHVFIEKNPGEATTRRVEIAAGPAAAIKSLIFTDEHGSRIDILKDPGLREHIGKGLMQWTGRLLQVFSSLSAMKKRVLSISVNGSDLMKTDLVDVFLTRCAREYAPTVESIRQRSLVKNELNLKVEEKDGKRTEIYLKIDEFKARMSAIPQGRALCAILGLEQSE